MKGKRTLLLHLGFWLLLIILDTLSLLTYDSSKEIKVIVYQELILYLFWAIVFYVNYLYFVKILYQRKILKFIIVFFLFILLYSYLVELIYQPVLFRIVTRPKKLFRFTILFFNIIIPFCICFMGNIIPLYD